MKKKFESCGHSFDAEFFPAESSCMIRFYDSKNEDFGGSLHDLVIAEPSYGFLLVQYIGDDAVMSGVLNEKYFRKYDGGYPLFSGGQSAAMPKCLLPVSYRFCCGYRI